MFKKATKGELIITSLVFLWIFIVNVVAVIFAKVPTWPMYFVTIFFFAMEADKKKIPSIFMGGTAGILLALLLEKGIGALAPSVGAIPAVSIMLFIILGLIIVGGNYLPWVLNNITFAYMTIATINMEIIDKNIVNWILMLLIGGAIILVGALGAVKLGTAIVSKGEKISKS